MKRALMKAPGGPLYIETSDAIPEAPPRGVIVKTSFGGICHSDLMWKENAIDRTTATTPNFFNIGFPLVLGHEVSGKVIKVGANVGQNDVKVGDKVLVYPWIGCCQCDDCHNDNTHCCTNRPTHKVGFDFGGGFGTHVSVVDTQYVVRIPDSIPENVACMLPCSGLTTYTAVAKVMPFLEAGKDQKYLLVIGAGGLGLWCIQIARARLPPNTKIICADISKERLDYVRQNGADDVILLDKELSGSSIPDDPFIKEMKEKSKGGFHAVIDVVNSHVTATRAVYSIRKGGVVAMVGLFGGEMKVDVWYLVQQRINLFGIKVGSRSHLGELVELAATGKLTFPPITYFSLDEVPEALVKLKQGKIMGRGVIKY